MDCFSCRNKGILMGTDLSLFCCYCENGMAINKKLTEDILVGMNDLLSDELMLQTHGKIVERFKGSEGIERILKLLTPEKRKE